MPPETTGIEAGVKLEGLLVDLADFTCGDQNLYWAAVRSEGLSLPPLEHLLDSLIRQRLLEADLPDEVRIQIGLRPTVETITLIDERPRCDLCAASGRQVAAMFDAPESRDAGAMWANLCQGCFVANSPGALGLGQGQALVTPGDLPWRFRASLGRAVRYWNRHGIDIEYPLRGEPPDELFAVIADGVDDDGDEPDEQLGLLAGLIGVAHRLVAETIADPDRSGSEFVLAVTLESGELTAQRYSSPEGSPYLATVIEQLDHRGGPWAMAATPGPDRDSTQLLVMAAGCSAHEPVAGVTTIAAGEVPITDNGWTFAAASDLLAQLGAL